MVVVVIDFLCLCFPIDYRIMEVNCLFCYGYEQTMLIQQRSSSDRLYHLRQQGL